ncbi:Phage tail tape measure protein [Haloferax volcanii]|nr:Phage tail tape measure protein [Haloferax alexandrinus]
MESAGQRMQSAGMAMTAGITAPLVAMGGLAVRETANFDQAMQKSIAVMGDVDEAMREDLEQTARDVATTTTQSHQQAAESYYFLASAGLDAAEAMEAMPEVAAFAEAGQMEMAQATDVATNVMSAFEMEASEMSEVTDTLTGVVSNHNQTMQGMSTAMSQVAPIASSLGMSIEETATAIGMMGDVGIQGERAGTALRNVLSQLSDPTSTVTEELEAMGVQTRTASGDVVSMTQLLSNMESAGVEAGDAARVFGTEAGPAMAALMQQGSSQLQENTQAIREMEGATQQMAQTQRDTLNAELQVMRSNLTDAGLAIGTTVIPMLSTLTGYVQGAAQWFQGLNSTQQNVILGFAALTAAAGPVLITAGMLAQSVVALSGAYTTLSGASTVLSGVLSGGLVPSLVATNVALGPITVPIWAIIAAIGALIGIVGALWYAWDNNVLGIRDTTTDAFNTVRGWFEAAPTWVLSLLGPVGWLYAAWRENLFGVQDVTGSVFDWIGDKIGWLIDKIRSIPGIDGGDIAPDQDPLDEAMPDQDAPGGAIPDPGTSLPDMGTQGEMDGYDYGQNFTSGAEAGIQADSFEVPASEAIAEEFGGVEVGDQITVDGARLEAMIDSTEGGVTADDLGLTQAQFSALARSRRSSSSPAGGSSSETSASDQSPPSGLLQSATGGKSEPDRLSASEVADAIRDALSGMAISLQGDLDVENLEDPVVEIVDAQLVAAGDELNRLRSRSP